MTPATTLVAFAAALALVFGAGLALGGVVGPVGIADAADTSGTSTDADHTEMDMSR